MVGEVVVLVRTPIEVNLRDRERLVSGGSNLDYQINLYLHGKRLDEVDSKGSIWIESKDGMRWMLLEV
jgi:hypothetical protein